MTPILQTEEDRINKVTVTNTQQTQHTRHTQQTQQTQRGRTSNTDPCIKCTVMKSLVKQVTVWSS